MKKQRIIIWLGILAVMLPGRVSYEEGRVEKRSVSVLCECRWDCFKKGVLHDQRRDIGGSGQNNVKGTFQAAGGYWNPGSDSTGSKSRGI